MKRLVDDERSFTMGVISKNLRTQVSIKLDQWLIDAIDLHSLSQVSKERTCVTLSSLLLKRAALVTTVTPISEEHFVSLARKAFNERDKE